MRGKAEPASSPNAAEKSRRSDSRWFAVTGIAGIVIAGLTTVLVVKGCDGPSDASRAAEVTQETVFGSDCMTETGPPRRLLPQSDRDAEVAVGTYVRLRGARYWTTNTSAKKHDLLTSSSRCEI